MSEAIVQRTAKSNKCKNSRKNERGDLKKKKVEAAEDEKYSESEDESHKYSYQFGWSDSDFHNAITIPLGLKSNEYSIDNDGDIESSASPDEFI